MRRDYLAAGALWVILSGAGYALIATWSPLPEEYAREAGVVDDAFLLLTLLAVPVFAFMVAVLVYAAYRWRSEKDEAADGRPIRNSRLVVGIWLSVTTVLALGILINPGFVGLADIRGEQSAELVIEVSGSRWFWDITYPDGSTTSEELVVPVDVRVRFDVTATDIVHSFWVPAFRTKIDAVPGRVTQLFVTPNRVGTLADDPGLRVQCAELCGLGHGAMAIPVRILPADEYEAWLDGLTVEAASKPGGA